MNKCEIEILNLNRKYKDALLLVQYSAYEDKKEKIVENNQVLLSPIMRN